MNEHEKYIDEMIDAVIEYVEKEKEKENEMVRENRVESKVNHPSHYSKGKYECLDVVKDLIKDMSGVEGALFFNVFKYLWRYPHKNGIEDLKKCEFYLKDLIAFNENI